MQFHPEKSLFDLPLVRRIAWLTIIFALSLSLVIALNSGLRAQFDYAGFNHAIEVFRVPLGVLALGLSLVGICGANHRSEQTKRQIERTSLQIELTRSQNDFANYYKHIEEFEKYCAKLKKPDTEVILTRNLYRKLFLKSRNGDFLISPDIVDNFNASLSKFIQLCFEIGSSDLDIYRGGIYDLLQLRKNLLSQYETLQTIESSSSAFVNLDGKEYAIFDSAYGIFFEGYRSLFNLIDAILRFDINYLTGPALSLINNMHMEGTRLKRINLYLPDPLDFGMVFEDEAMKYVLY